MVKRGKRQTIEYSLCAIQLSSLFIIQEKNESKKKQQRVQGVKKSEDGLGVGVDEWTSERQTDRGCFVVVVSEYERV